MIGEVHHCDWRTLAELVRDTVGQVDALVSDPPYSDRTHAKQRHGRTDTRNPAWVSSRGLTYAHWSSGDVAAFCEAWAPIVRGWWCVLTDSELYPSWRDSLGATGMYVFAPLPLVQFGMNVRLAGDGPSSWTCWLVVARPRVAPFSKWGTLRGAYVGNAFDAGENSATTSSKRSLVVGGKPVWAMEAIVSDYTRPGDLVVDPCCGGGTTLVAAKLLGRRFIGGDIDASHVEIARKRVSSITMGRPLALPFGDVG